MTEALPTVDAPPFPHRQGLCAFMSVGRSIIQSVRDRFGKNESTLLKGSAGSFVVQSFGALFALALQVTLARILGVEDYGTYTYVWAWINIAVLVGTFGFKTASVKFVAQYESLSQWERLSSYLGFSRRVVLLVSLGTALMVAAGAYLFAREQVELRYAFLVAAVVIPILARARSAAAELRGFQHVVQALVPEKILFPLCLYRVSASFFLALRRSRCVRCIRDQYCRLITRSRSPRPTTPCGGTTIAVRDQDS